MELSQSNQGSVAADDDHHFRREDRVLRWQRIASHLAGHPHDLSIALENIERWMKLGRVHPGPLGEWRGRIFAAQQSAAAFQAFVEFLAAPNHDTERIKSCAPFVGLSCLNESK
jgi:hypothetical protein